MANQTAIHIKNAGLIWAKYYATCGRCGGHSSLGAITQFDAQRAVKDAGWKFQEDEGWVCPVCIEETPSAPARK